MYGIHCAKGSADLVQTAYTAATKPDFQLGDLVWVKEHGIRGLFRFSLSVGGALAKGDVLAKIDDTGLNYRYTDSVYSTAGQSGKTELAYPAAAYTASAVAKHAHAGMVMAVTTGTGKGQFGQVVDNEAASTAIVPKWYLSRPFPTALANDEGTQVIAMDWVKKVTAYKLNVVGVCQLTVADGEYFFRQVAGLCFVKEATGAGHTSNTQVVLVEDDSRDGEAILGDTGDTAGHVGDTAGPFGVMISKIGTAAGDLALANIFCASQIYC